MKLRSIISLIVAAALILVGIIVCVVATTMASSSDVMLFPSEDDNGNLVYRMDITGTSKITIDSADADITIIGGADESTIEVINFNANYYKLSQSNGSLIFGQVDDFFSMFKFWDNGFSFKGMRYILRYGDDAAGKKQVVIRLADDADITMVHLTTGKGKISVSDCSFVANYTIRSDKGVVEMNDVTSALAMNISGDTPEITLNKCGTDKLTLSSDTIKANINDSVCKTTGIIAKDGDTFLKACEISDLNADMADANLTISPFTSATGVITAKAGNVSIDLPSPDSLAAIISTVTGKISVNGVFVESFSKNAPTPERSLTVNTESGDVYITYPTNDIKE